MCDAKVFFPPFNLQNIFFGEGDILLAEKQAGCGGILVTLLKYAAHRDASRSPGCLSIFENDD